MINNLKVVNVVFCAVLFFASTSNSFAQVINPKPFEPKQGHLVNIQFAFTSPGGDLKDRFGINQSIGLDWRYKTKSNFTFGAEYNWLFGNNVKELVMLDSMIGASGEIIDKNGAFSVIRINQRGHTGFVKVGKIFPFKSKNKNSGLYVELGLGAIIHKMDVMAPEATVPQLNGDYAKGYDRLTGGMAFHQFIGWQNLSPNRRTNYTIGFDFTQAQTNSMRAYNFDTREADTKKRLDIINSFKVAITLPIYTKKSDDEEFYFD